MKSKKPFSTVTYNTEEFLRSKLDELIEKRVLNFYAYVFHYPEEDEEKSHFHVYFIPNGQQDTDQLREELEELDPTNIKPLKPLPFTSSKWADWKQYNDHDVAYLASKGQTRKYHYSDMDYVTSDTLYFQELNHQIDRSKLNRNALVIQWVNEGKDFADLIRTGQVPVQMIGSYKMMYDLLMNQKLLSEPFRGYDKTTGEVKVSHTPLERPWEEKK